MDKPLSDAELEQMKRFNHHVELNPSGDHDDIWLGMYAHDVPRLLATIDVLKQLCHPIVRKALKSYCTKVDPSQEEYTVCFRIMKALRQCSDSRRDAPNLAPYLRGESL